MDDVDDVDDLGTILPPRERRKKRAERIRKAAKLEAADLRDRKKATPPRKPRHNKPLRVAKTPKKIVTARFENVDKDLSGHCGCRRINHLFGLPIDVVHACRTQYNSLNFKQRKHFQFYELLSFHLAAQAKKELNLKQGFRTTASGNRQELPLGSTKRSEYEAAAVKPEFCIRDPDALRGKEGVQESYPCCQKALQIVYRGFGGSTMDEMNKLIKQGHRHHWSEVLKTERQRVSPVAQSIVSFVCWVEHQLGEADPCGGKTVVGCDSLANLYRIYSAMMENDGWGAEYDNPKPATEQYFRSVYQQYGGPFQKILKHQNKLGKCTYCAELKLAEAEFPMGSAARKEVVEHHRRHIKWQGLQRMRYWHHRMKAKTLPWR
jgi:hypothetical protein